MKLLPYELWMDIPGLENYYQASTMGDIKSLDRPVVNSSCGRKRLAKGTPIKQQLNNKGRLVVPIHIHGKRYTKQVSLLVARTFIPNPDNLPEVNHKDENPLNNQVSNLEWCSRVYNQNYGTCINRMAQKHKKPINQYTKNGEFIRQFDSAVDAARELSLTNDAICCCLKGRSKTCGGYIWRYAVD